MQQITVLKLSDVWAGDAAAFPSKIFLGKIDQIWLNLGENLGAKVIRYGQNQNLASPKHLISYSCASIRHWTTEHLHSTLLC